MLKSTTTKHITNKTIMRSSLVQSIQHLKLADEFMKDFVRQAPNTRGAFMFSGYSQKVNWILKDIVTYPHFGDDVRKGIKAEVESDAFGVYAIFEKIPLLNPEQRNIIESLIEDALSGKTLKVIIKEDDGATDTE
jgi:hypothetical protein